jgi:hypothetical protein
MTHKHAIVMGLVVGAVAGYFLASTLVSYQPWKWVAQHA